MHETSRRELRLVKPNVVEVDLRDVADDIKADLHAALAPVLSKYNLVLVKSQQALLSDEVSLVIRASVPDGLDQDCFTRDLLTYSRVFGFDPGILGRSIVRNDAVSGEKESFVVNGLDVVDKASAKANKFRVFNKNNPREVRLLDYDVLKSIFPEHFYMK